MIRLFQFKNNFLSDNIKMVKAEYSSVGYFDGLDTKIIEESEGQIIFSLPTQIHLQEDEDCDYFNIVGMRKDNDDMFWNNNKEQFLFVTCIRFKNCSKNLCKIIEKIEQEYKASCYLTFDSSDLIVCLKTNSYSTGYNAIEKYPVIVTSLDSSNGVQKSFSVMSVSQIVLDSLTDLDLQQRFINEEVSCLLRCVIKDWNKIDAFETELKTESKAVRCVSYGILGSDDWLVMLEKIKILDLFHLYGKDKLLTHSNRFYRDAFYNIKTEILVESERGGKDRDDRI